jgi:hypothetical protein
VRRSKFLLLFIPVLLGAACDPLAPGATGQLSVSPEVNLEEGHVLEIRILPDVGEPFDLAQADFSDANRHWQDSLPLAELEIPIDYFIGGGLGSSEHEHWRVVAWISKSANVNQPAPGEWYGTSAFDAGDCGVAHSGFCGVMTNVDLKIESLLGGGALRKVESELEPGEYIEESFETYTMRCREGDDSARSIGTYIVTVHAGADSTTQRLIAETHGVRDGTIQDCWMENVHGDEKAEVLVFTKSAGSGGFAELHMYEFDGTNLHVAELPDPDSDLVDGYQGRDWYDITDGRLIRTFPVYLKGDANCCPGGGSRTLEFDVINNSWRESANINRG